MRETINVRIKLLHCSAIIFTSMRFPFNPNWLFRGSIFAGVSMKGFHAIWVHIVSKTLTPHPHTDVFRSFSKAATCEISSIILIWFDMICLSIPPPFQWYKMRSIEQCWSLMQWILFGDKLSEDFCLLSKWSVFVEKFKVKKNRKNDEQSFGCRSGCILCDGDWCSDVSILEGLD